MKVRHTVLKIFSRVTLCVTVGMCLTSSAFGRVWSSSSGAYQMEAEEISFNDTLVVLKRPTGELVAVELKDLAPADQAYVRTQEVKDAERKSAQEMQIWTAKDGMKVRARVTAYGRKVLKVERKLGSVLVNDTRFSRLDPIHQKLVLRIISELEDKQLENEGQLAAWVKTLSPSAKSYPLEGVMLELESGDEIAVPFFLFSTDDVAVLEPGWELWKEREEHESSREQESFLMRSAATAYQRDLQAQQRQRQGDRQIELLKLELLGAATGVISIWQVGLMPGPGVYGRPTSVMVPGQNSEIATEIALQRYPGFVLVGVRRASR